METRTSSPMALMALELRRAVLSATRLLETKACLDILLEASRRNEPRPAPPKQSYTVRDVADRWSRSPDFVRDYFRNVPGILHKDRPATRTKHRYFSFTIPTAVLLREEGRLPPS